MRLNLKLAARKSDLARWQAVQVARALERLPQKPQTEFLFKASLGDQDLETPLARMTSKGVFTEDFYQDLVQGQCDLVVHSWKDLPVEPRNDTRIAMTLARADVRDLLLVPEVVWAEAARTGRLSILTSSPRRVHNLSVALPQLLPAPVALEFINVRGNVPTRLNKMHAQGCALVLAKAGVDRLLEAEAENFLTAGVSLRQLLRACRFMILPIGLNPCAAAQGALAVEVRRRSDGGVADLCAQLNDAAAFAAVERERAILASYGGGCQQKIGATVLTRSFGQVVSLRGITEQGEPLSHWAIESATPWSRAERQQGLFPHESAQNTWFERIPLTPPPSLRSSSALLVAHRAAWPAGLQVTPQQIVWTAGVKTWRHLAKTGVWVHGSSEGLGEAEDPRLENLCGPSLQWTKLSHRGGLPGPHGDLLATYELRPKPKSEMPDLRGKTHFFWSSPSSFDAALAHFPDEIRAGHNSCGPGSTYEHLRHLPDLKNPPKVFIDFNQFLRESAPEAHP